MDVFFFQKTSILLKTNKFLLVNLNFINFIVSLDNYSDLFLKRKYSVVLSIKGNYCFTA